MSEDDMSFEYDSGSDISFEEGEARPAPPEIEGTSILTTKFGDFKQWTLEAFIRQDFLEPCYQLKQSQLPQCSIADLLIMCQYYKWQVDTVINNYYDNYDQLIKDCGLVIQPQNQFHDRSNYMCMICCEDYEETKTFHLSCKHEFCEECYGNYVKAEVTSGGLIRCMNATCNLTIPHEIVQELYNRVQPEPEEFTKLGKSLESNILLKSSVKLYIDSRKSKFKWCPAPDCNTLIEFLDHFGTKIGPEDIDSMDGITEDIKLDESAKIDISSIPIVPCPNDHEFCYNCQYENHLPCPCNVVKAWIKKCEDDSETVHWIEANTHGCPNCAASIEKNGGCNHMTCSTCRYEFCWICMKVWSSHGSQFYSCDKFDPEEKEAVNSNQKNKRQTLQRYLHYFKRFSVHESSMRGDLKTLLTVEEKMNIFMKEQSKNNKSNLSWIDIEFFKTAHKALVKGRKTLKWGYCFMFYLEPSNFAEVFEQNQGFVSETVEELSKIFEEINHKKNKDKSTMLIMKNKANIIHLSTLLTKRQQALIESANCGITEGTLKLESSS